MKRIGSLVVYLAMIVLINGSTLPEAEEERKMHPGAYKSRYRQGSEDPVYESRDHWYTSAQKSIESKLQEKQIVGRAKNVIFFLGDGMSVPTIAAARIFKGQEANLEFGEDGVLHMESFPNIGVSKTYCSDVQVADSACTATAYLCGTKAHEATMGLAPEVKRSDCDAQALEENHVSSILAWSQAAGKSTGIVTTARVTHASPGGAYAHIADRDWENDYDVSSRDADPDICTDIAKQLIMNEPGKNINVILGGGRQKFIPNTETDVEDPTERYKDGQRNDTLDLTKKWKENHPEKSSYVWNKAELLAVDLANTDYILGLFAPSHVAYLDKQVQDNDPSLEEMTRVAIDILKKNPNGFFLFVEGGRIDHAHHDGNAKRALWETIEFDKAIKLADDMTLEEDTLILVTADHAHAMTFAGYPVRNNPIMGIAGMSDIESNDDHGDDLAYPTLSYANGPGYRNHIYNATTDQCQRHDISEDDMEDINYLQVATAPLDSETHGGDDVLIFSRGPFSHLLTGVQQQSYIPHVLAYASCVGTRAKYCDGQTSSAPISLGSFFLISLSVCQLLRKL